MEVRIYSPEPALRYPREFFAQMWRDLCSSFGLAYQLALRDFKAMYRQSVLGYLWAFLPPLVTTGLFLFLRGGKAFTTDQESIPYLPFLLVGTLMWQTFADAIQGPLRTITTSKQMIIKINFPQEALILSGLGLTLINFAIRLVILVPALIFFYIKYPEMNPTISLAGFPLAVISLMLIGYTIGIWLAPLGMLFKDVNRALVLVITFWMFITPVVFPLVSEGKLAALQLLNPVTPVLVTARELALGLPLTMLGHGLLVAGAFIAFLLIGLTLYRIALPHIIARLGM